MKDGTRVVNANWNPVNRKLNVNANDAGNQNDNLGCRLSRRSISSSARI